MIERQLAELEKQIAESIACDTAQELAGSLMTKYAPQIFEVLKAAQCIRHWHDTGRNNEGMIVSAEKVRELWEALAALSAALPKEGK